MRRRKRDYEGELAYQIRLLGLPEPTREHRFHPTRKWRFDLAWPDLKLAVEIEGVSRHTSRHQTIAGYRADCEKYAEAATLGWRVLRVVQDHVKTGQALDWVQKMVRRCAREGPLRVDT